MAVLLACKHTQIPVCIVRRQLGADPGQWLQCRTWYGAAHLRFTFATSTRVVPEKPASMEAVSCRC